MNWLRHMLSVVALALATAAVAQPAVTPGTITTADPQDSAAAAADAVAHGGYLVNLLGCGRCHTEGYLTGDRAEGPYLAGSTIGIAYTAYRMEADLPGVVFPSNLTGDPETGLGTWSEADILRAMTHGIAPNGHERLTVMPWGNYNALSTDDLNAIAAYLKSLGPVRRVIPAAVPEGEPSTSPYIRFGTYRFTPHWHLGTDPDLLLDIPDEPQGDP